MLRERLDVPVLTHLVELLFCERHERVHLFGRPFEVFDGEGIGSHAAYIKIETYLEQLR